MSQEIDNTVETKVETPELKKYQYAHLILSCDKCKSEYVLEENVKGGLQFTLPTTNLHKWVLACKNCGNKMMLSYIESSKQDDVNETSNEQNTDVIESVDNTKE